MYSSYTGGGGIFGDETEGRGGQQMSKAQFEERLKSKGHGADPQRSSKLSEKGEE
jgi:hypothetical protein